MRSDSDLEHPGHPPDPQAPRPPDPEDCDLAVGRVAGTYGWRGEVKVAPLTDFPERFLKLRQVCLERPDGKRMLAAVSSARLLGGRILISFQGFPSREQVAQLNGSTILIRRSEAVKLPAASYFVHDILGLEVETLQGERLGKVVEVIKGPANDVYVTEKAMIPALKQVIRQVDLKAGRMVVDGAMLEEE